MKKLLLCLCAVSGCTGPERDPLTDVVRYRPTSPAPRPDVEAPRSLTLEAALAWAEERHPELAAARARVQAAEGRAQQAGLLPNPTLIAKVESVPLGDGERGDAELLAGISQRLPVGGRSGAARDVERLEAERLSREFEVRRRELRSRVQGAFATALYAAEVARLQAGQLEGWRRAAALVRARAGAGDVAPDEAARAALEEARARLEAERAEGLRELAGIVLAGALGDPGLRIAALEGPLESALALPELEGLLKDLEQGPYAALAQAEVETARARVDLARAERVPDVTLDLFYRRIGASDIDAFDAGISVPLPFFDRNQGRLQEARAERREAEARAQGVRGEARRRVREGHARLSGALRRAQRAREELLPNVAVILDVAERRHAAGDLGLAELLAARRESASARLSYLEGLREVMEAWGELRPFLP